MTPRATLPPRPPVWTITGGPPPKEGIRALARLCLSVARRRLAERAAEAGADGEQDDHQEHTGTA